MTNQLQKIDAEESALAVNDPVLFAVRNNSPVDVIERMMAVRRELKAEAAKEAFVAAMTAFQSECPNIAKTRSGAKNAYKFAGLDDIIEKVKPLLLKHGFSFSINSEVGERWVKAIVTVTHSLGHSIPSEFKVPVDNKNPMMTEPQRFGGAMTFSKRYCFCNAFGILTADEDRDGQAPKERHGEARTTTAPAKPQLTEADIRRQLRERIWNRSSTQPGIQGSDDNETAANLKKWLVTGRHMEPSEDLGKLSNDRLKAIADTIENEFDASF